MKYADGALLFADLGKDELMSQWLVYKVAGEVRGSGSSVVACFDGEMGGPNTSVFVNGERMESGGNLIVVANGDTVSFSVGNHKIEVCRSLFERHVMPELLDMLAQ